MANSGRVELNSSVTDSLCSVHGIIYAIFYGRIRIPRISGNFSACADSVYQALLSAHEREPGFEAISSYTKEKTARVKHKKRLKCSIYCAVSNELVYDSSDCLVTVVKHK